MSGVCQGCGAQGGACYCDGDRDDLDAGVCGSCGVDGEGYYREVKKLQARVKELEAENKRLRDALNYIDNVVFSTRQELKDYIKQVHFGSKPAGGISKCKHKWKWVGCWWCTLCGTVRQYSDKTVQHLLPETQRIETDRKEGEKKCLKAS